MTASIVLSIDRASLSLSPLLISTAYGDTAMVITTFTPATVERRNVYAPDKDWLNGSLQTAAPLKQTVLGWTAEPPVGGTESDYTAALAELAAALGQFAYMITVTTNGDAQTYACDSGSITVESRNVANLRYSNPSVTVTVPCYPVAS